MSYLVLNMLKYKILELTKHENLKWDLNLQMQTKVAMIDSVNEEEITKERFTTVEFRFAKLMATIIFISFFG